MYAKCIQYNTSEAKAYERKYSVGNFTGTLGVLYLLKMNAHSRNSRSESADQE